MRPIQPYAAHLLVAANEKGGTGKSTLVFHLAVCLQRQGQAVAVVDLDHRQRATTRFFENRQAFTDRHATGWRLPGHALVLPTRAAAAGPEEDAANLESVLTRLAAEHAFILVDCPSGHSLLGHMAQANANTLLTPLNDSFLDLDLLAPVDPDTQAVRGFGRAAEAVWESRKRRAASGLPGLDWVVLGNRLPTTRSQNRARMEQALQGLKGRLVLRIVPGLSERVIYRELFPRGLTLEDLPELAGGRKPLASHAAARRELHALLRELSLPGVTPEPHPDPDRRGKGQAGSG